MSQSASLITTNTLPFNLEAITLSTNLQTIRNLIYPNKIIQFVLQNAFKTVNEHLNEYELYWNFNIFIES